MSSLAAIPMASAGNNDALANLEAQTQKLNEPPQGCCAANCQHWSQYVLATGFFGGIAIAVTGVWTQNYEMLSYGAYGAFASGVGYFYIRKFVPLKAFEVDAQAVAVCVKQIAQENQTFKTRVDELTADREQYSKELSQWKEVSAKAQSDIAAKLKQIDTLNNQLKATAVKLSQLQGLYGRLKSTLQQFTTQAAAFKNDSADLDKNVSGLSGVSSALKVTVDDFSKDSKQIEADDDEFRKQNQELLGTVTSFYDQMKQVETTYAAHKKEIDTLTAQVKALSTPNNKLQIGVQGVEDERLKLEEERKKWQEILAERKKEIQQLKDVLANPETLKKLILANPALLISMQQLSKT